MEVIDAFYQDGVIDCFTIVFDEQSPINPYYYTMLALSRYAVAFSQFTEGYYEPGTLNEHLGSRVTFDELDDRIKDHVRDRLAYE